MSQGVSRENLVGQTDSVEVRFRYPRDGTGRHPLTPVPIRLGDEHRVGGTDGTSLSQVVLNRLIGFVGQNDEIVFLVPSFALDEENPLSALIDDVLDIQTGRLDAPETRPEHQVYQSIVPEGVGLSDLPEEGLSLIRSEGLMSELLFPFREVQDLCDVRIDPLSLDPLIEQFDGGQVGGYRETRFPLRDEALFVLDDLRSGHSPERISPRLDPIEKQVQGSPIQGQGRRFPVLRGDEHIEETPPVVGRGDRLSRVESEFCRHRLSDK